MKITVIASEEQQEEFMRGQVNSEAVIDCIRDPRELGVCDGCIDLLFDHADDRIERLRSCAAKIILVNSVTFTLKELPDGFSRMLGWNYFLGREVTEIAAVDSDLSRVKDLLRICNKEAIPVPDIPGFISARVISTIINEAYFTLEEGISTREEIDTAMKLGTNYPVGPFEWSTIIGLKNVSALLQRMAIDNPRYLASDLLIKEALSS